MIYSHPIYQNYQDIINLNYIINYQEFEEKILTLKEKSEIYKLREKEFNKINSFLFKLIIIFYYYIKI